MNYAAIQDTIETFIVDNVGSKDVVIGLSGGIDSSLACVLAKNALGADNVHGLVLTNDQFAREAGLAQVSEFADAQGIQLSKIDVSNVRSSIVENLDSYGAIHKPTVDVRVCDMYLRLYTSLTESIYLGTINATERVTGWYPKGALTGDFTVLGDLYKKQIKELASYMGLSHLVSTVSAEAKNLCSGCGELIEFEGISYDDLDSMLLLHRRDEDHFVELCKEAGFAEHDYSRVEERIRSVAHKSTHFPNYPIVNEAS